MLLLRSAIALIAVLAALSATAVAQRSLDRAQYMRVHGRALPPFGYVQFCQRNSGECAPAERASLARFDASPAHLSELDRVNRVINASVSPATDLELYGREEFWTFPVGKGDCEDYVVLKRRILMNHGWPASSLLITVVRDEAGDGHAVLTARTRQGDFVLDNKVDDVRLWNQTPYRYLMRQSYLNPQLWMALDPRASQTAATVAGVKAAK